MNIKPFNVETANSEVNGMTNDLLEIHLQVWGKCPVCNKHPRAPHEDTCEDCEQKRRIRYHGLSQSVRTDKRCIEPDEEP